MNCWKSRALHGCLAPLQQRRATGLQRRLTRMQLAVVLAGTRGLAVRWSPAVVRAYPITPPVSSEMLLPVTTETTLRPQSTTSATSSSGL